MMKKFVMTKKLIALTIMCGAVFAAAHASAEEYGYIFKLNPDVVIPFAETEGVERIASDEPLYAADTLEDVYNFVNADNIEIIAENAPVYLHDAESETYTEPNDPYYSSQWSLPLIKFPKLWNSGYRGDGATVCIIDTGLFTEHPDINSDKVIGTYNMYAAKSEEDASDITVESDEDASGDADETEEDASDADDETEEEICDVTDVTDTSGHGTSVAGIIAAQTNNGIYVSGIADEVEMVIIKAFDSHTLI
ncbi:MAG: S8 family serine peptidase [Oscillospiraceae bacterium]|nr:S8 family serine peptidase [Oscillospiraceae bacterium]